MPEYFISQLQHQLTRPLPGRQAQQIAMPGLSYGRHCGPAPRTARQAAVVVMLMHRDGQWSIPLTKRPLAIKHHGGQISLPGGRIETGESTVEAALREFEEELGVRPVAPELCGELSPLYVYASDNLVHPVVMACQHPAEPWVPDRVEVDVVIDLPLQTLCDSSRWNAQTIRRPIVRERQQCGELTFRGPGLNYGEHWIWGATGMILAELASCLTVES
ncbi:NUDIX hydrolase [Roseimaritima ulvae]|uniref:Putative NUDIX hydrolase n=1 Tax=Roseimaritima ulvae TaxID=980254 RepID=A0A5B9QW52_9BACT|nr:CoA pyrophosphatase [Roseimaritima ulvae]QEG42139.1 putative NUDIX hydrolase [Roseimaritima ulvae]